MVDETDIPDAAKWLIASRLASRLPVMYDITFRKKLGDEYDELEQDIWIETGKEVKSVADAFKLPVKDSAGPCKYLPDDFKDFFSPGL